MTAHAHRPSTTAIPHTPVQIAALAIGVVFLLAGIAGFIPGLTTGFGEMSFAGHASGAMLLGVFQVSILHNLVHLLFGVAGVAMARTWAGARTFLLGGGVVYGLIWLFGLIVDHDSAANFIPVNTADNWLHLGLALGMILLGAALGRRGSD
ncbi:DUF4383 domain-containing protein [Phytomonospora endophytica]|uniref:DUF4383 domain-containing protein n=1 Tax=Phytomonospora endophytica TaxID=714109 RepID=A0A841FN38_9ACTN|nr:DUF4383 domain-containing protein [Phytomonospora endophytica]MBB6034019.1 hypothetical protein [Phytomonospora endophytica]GIG64461.1 membrane protein [Phytomonospora endophytica]